jgi:hypothetical protein
VLHKSLVAFDCRSTSLILLKPRENYIFLQCTRKEEEEWSGVDNSELIGITFDTNNKLVCTGRGINKRITRLVIVYLALY